jgi:hypothetical protein
MSNAGMGFNIDGSIRRVRCSWTALISNLNPSRTIVNINRVRLYIEEQIPGLRLSNQNLRVDP